MKVLALAPCLDGNDVSEAWSTYQWVRHLADTCDITVLTYHKRGHVPASKQLPGVRVVEWQDMPLAWRAERFNSMVMPGYAVFYVRARRWLRRALASGERFDLIHQLAPLAPRYPCPAVGLGTPWIVGPLGGSIKDPDGFVGDLGKPPAYVRLRELDSWRLEHDPLLRASLEGATCVVGVAPYVRDLLSRLAIKRFEVESETGVLDIPGRRLGRRREPGDLKLLFVGRIVPTKGLIYAVRALGRLPDLPNVELDVLGEGSDLARCLAAAQDLGVAARIRFHGSVDRSEVDRFYSRADVFVFPSLREPSGNVVFEAMRAGLPIIACAAGGPGHVVDETSGDLVGVSSPEQLTSDLAHAIRRLALDPARAARLGNGAQERLAQVALWQVKTERMRNLYESLLAS